ncbi:MAG TPA: 4-alpha-glucanotransferase [Tepidisphaeraceae bacterium]|nr:4-alpha-glucanotransferase [Tepidisphaeraceae bacterium]
MPDQVNHSAAKVLHRPPQLMEEKADKSTPSTTFTPRSSGILLHISSLPSRYGVGDFGAAQAWLKRLQEAGQSWWQMLPLGPPGAGDSPYQCFSAFAGNPDLISPDLLIADGLLSKSDLRAPGFPESRVDYPRVRQFKRRFLSAAFERFSIRRSSQLQDEFTAFASANANWLDDYALFMAIKEARPAISWMDWPKDLARRKKFAIASSNHELRDSIKRLKFKQFIFFRQLETLRERAKEAGVRLIGDLPIFISDESSDVWANPHLFLLDRNRRPKFVAGVPPDCFSCTGQRWGNPVYNWRAMKADGFRWWMDRTRTALVQADLVRLDHFRGFAAYWQIPAENPTAEFGRWARSPGGELFEKINQAMKNLPFIAEDLGLITPDVERLRDRFGMPGMRVLQFGFGASDNPHSPHNYVGNCIAYTGTHDNDTTVGWWKSLERDKQREIERYVPGATGDIAWTLMRLAWASVAGIAIAPMQDILRRGTSARMNMPGTGTGNWQWRMPVSALNERWTEPLAELTETYGRAQSTGDPK